MGIGTRIYIVEDDDSLKGIILTRYERMRKGVPGEALLQYAGRRMRYIFAMIEMANRQPVELVRLTFSYLPFDSEGQLDRSEFETMARLALDSLPPTEAAQPEQIVVDAEYKFAKKRYRDQYLWSPTPEIESAIITAIFGKTP